MEILQDVCKKLTFFVLRTYFICQPPPLMRIRTHLLDPPSLPSCVRTKSMTPFCPFLLMDNNWTPAQCYRHQIQNTCHQSYFVAISCLLEAPQQRCPDNSIIESLRKDDDNDNDNHRKPFQLSAHAPMVIPLTLSLSPSVLER